MPAALTDCKRNRSQGDSHDRQTLSDLSPREVAHLADSVGDDLEGCAHDYNASGLENGSRWDQVDCSDDQSQADSDCGHAASELLPVVFAEITDGTGEDLQSRSQQDDTDARR
jgi:hypothetical protein